MRKASRQCILIFKLLTTSILLSSCVNSIYQEIENRIDTHYEEKRILRYCTFSLINFYRTWQDAQVLHPDIRSFNFGVNSSYTKNTLDNFLANNKNTQNNIAQIVDLLLASKPRYFAHCKNFLENNCIDFDTHEKVRCHELNANTFYYNKVKNSPLYGKLKKEKQDSINKKIDAKNHL